MTTAAGAMGTRHQAKVILEYVAPATPRPVALRYCVWYIVTLASILFLSTAAAVAAITTG